MTVKEPIELLNELNPNAKVRIIHDYNSICDDWFGNEPKLRDEMLVTPSADIK